MKKDNFNLIFSEMFIEFVSHPELLGDCHHNAELFFKELRRLNFNVELVKGVFLTDSGKKILHSWLEYDGKIYELDCRQLGIESKVGWEIIEDKETKKKYLKLSDEEFNKISKVLLKN